MQCVKLLDPSWTGRGFDSFIATLSFLFIAASQPAACWISPGAWIIPATMTPALGKIHSRPSCAQLLRCQETSGLGGQVVKLSFRETISLYIHIVHRNRYIPTYINKSISWYMHSSIQLHIFVSLSVPCPLRISVDQVQLNVSIPTNAHAPSQARSAMYTAENTNLIRRTTLHTNLRAAVRSALRYVRMCVDLFIRSLVS